MKSANRGNKAGKKGSAHADVIDKLDITSTGRASTICLLFMLFRLT